MASVTYDRWAIKETDGTLWCHEGRPKLYNRRQNAEADCYEGDTPVRVRVTVEVIDDPA